MMPTVLTVLGLNDFPDEDGITTLQYSHAITGMACITSLMKKYYYQTLSGISVDIGSLALGKF